MGNCKKRLPLSDLPVKNASEIVLKFFGHVFLWDQKKRPWVKIEVKEIGAFKKAAELVIGPINISAATFQPHIAFAKIDGEAFFKSYFPSIN